MNAGRLHVILSALDMVLCVIQSASGQGELRVHRKRRWPGPAASYKNSVPPV